MIADKVSDINHDFIFNHKVFYAMLIICLFNHIILSFCEVVMSDQEYSIHNFSNFCNRTDLKLLLHCGSFYDIRTERHMRTEIFIEIEEYHFNKLVNSIIINEFNY